MVDFLAWVAISGVAVFFILCFAGIFQEMRYNCPIVRNYDRYWNKELGTVKVRIWITEIR